MSMLPPPPSSPIPPPPPSFDAPGQVLGAPSVPGGLGAPPFQVPPPGALPVPPARSSKKGLWIALAALVVVGAGVAAAVVLMGGDDEAGPPAKVAAAAAAMRAEIDAADVSADQPFADTDNCLLPIEVIAPTAPAVAAVGTFTAVEEPYSAVILSESEAITFIECSAGVEGESLLGTSVATAPTGDLEAAIEGYLPSFDFTFETPQPYRGGTLLTYCATPPPDAGVIGFCESDWVGPGVVLGIFADPDTVPKDALERWLKKALDAMVDHVASESGTSTSTTTG